MESKNYYETLGITKDASEKDIRNAYRKLAFQYHPDRNKDNPDSAAKMKAVNEAYAVLSDRTKRSEYDTMRRQFGSSAHSQFRQAYTEHDIFRGSDINRIFEEMAKSFGFRSHDEIFKDFYGQGYRSFQFKRSGTFRRGFAFSGASKGGDRAPTQIPLQGHRGRFIKFILKRSLGIEFPENGADITDTVRLTPSQAVRGGRFFYFYRKRGKKLIVTIPPGVINGQRIRLTGLGKDGKGGGTPGDLYLKVEVRKPFFQLIKDFFSRIFK